ncbi:MAG: FAD:protein FMN transferase [Christensenella sp.]|uniref:FAD:protein FMN transferase n=1 Tax=Christensenella sp. TaxID=1935934 RepID=UPI002B1FA4DF|nr:FAD:protein FMN transferase [Christensenella sp.]MEA5002175.1 FAD:protein FMN transferase [Christensenella sp.]
MKRILLCCLAICCIFAFTACAPAAQTGESFAMDTIITQTVYAKNDSVIGQNNQILRDIENKMSKTIPTSDIGRMNAQNTQDVEISDDTAQVLKTCVEHAALTDGAFDPALGGLMAAWGFGTQNAHIPGEAELEGLLAHTDYNAISAGVNEDGKAFANAGGTQVDLGGAGKGYALDRLAQNLTDNGVSSAILSLGGSIYAVGTKPDGSAYKIGIRDPSGSENDYMATLELDGKFVSTSGTYERGFTQDGTYYSHILDPKTGYPVKNELASVTVICPSGILSDIYSTALFVMGPEKGIAFAHGQGVDALFLTNDKQMIATDGFAEKYGLSITNKDYHG